MVKTLKDFLDEKERAINTQKEALELLLKNIKTKQNDVASAKEKLQNAKTNISQLLSKKKTVDESIDELR